MLFLLFPLPLFAGETGFSVQVTKPDFSFSSAILQTNEDRHQLTIKLTNTGTMDAQDLSLLVMYPNNMSYTGSQFTDAELTTSGNRLGQLLRLSIPIYPQGEERRVVLLFKKEENQENEEANYLLSIVSPHSLPVYLTLSEQRGSFVKKDFVQRIFQASYLRYYSLKRWVSAKIST